MKMTQLFSRTLREAPAEAEVASHQLLLRAGFIKGLAAGIFTYLPLAQRSLTKIENVMRREMDAIGGQEISMPVIQPADIWQETGRWFQIGSEMGRFKDKNGRDMVLAFTHEEAVADLVRKDIRSYRQLPALIYHLQTKWRDDPRPRAGLLRAREFTMKDSYSLDADWEGLDQQYRAHYQAYFNIFHRCGLPVIAVKSDVGVMGGQLAHEFMYLAPVGEDTLLLCDQCGYAANRQIARFQKNPLPEESPRPLEKVATPDCKSIEALAAFLDVPKAKTAKAVFAIASIAEEREMVDRFVFAIVRGDMEVNETKLANAVKASELRPATEDEIRAAGAEPGYASPVALSRTSGRQGLFVVVDDLIPQSPNLVAGANEAGFHLLNVNLGRDYQAHVIADIASAEAGSLCPRCGHAMRAERGVEVGNIFKLGTRYSEAMHCYFLDKDGQSQPVIMGSYGIGSGRLLASVAEEHHDEQGLSWPVTVAPYQVHLVVLGGRKEKGGGAQVQGSGGQAGHGDTEGIAGVLYQQLMSAGVEVLYDDREESPGIKFNDADLIGLPLRLTVSGRSLSGGGVECKRRDQGERLLIPLDQTVASVKGEINSMESEIAQQVGEAPYQE